MRRLMTALILSVIGLGALSTAEAPAIVVGDVDGAERQVDLTLRRLGADDLMGGFRLMALAKLADGRNVTASGLTDGNGRMLISLTDSVRELRVYPFGDYVIPDGWANVPIANFDFSDGPARWELRVRSMRNVVVQGAATVANDDVIPARANVAFAQLDVGQDGSARLFDRPIGTLVDRDGNYRLELPKGYYQVWCYWADRRTDDWTQYIVVESRVAVFGNMTVNLELTEAPYMRGRVVDASTGQGIAASIDLFTNQYLRQLRNFTSDGQSPDRYGPDDEPEYWPVGTFNFQAWMVDPNDFVVIVRPRGTDAVARIIDEIDLAAAKSGDLVLELFTDDMRAVDIVVNTHEQDLPVNRLDVRMIPRQMDAPRHIRENYQVSAFTDEEGRVSFLGLPPGEYEVFVNEGTHMLGAVTVTSELAQEFQQSFPIPFVYGEVRLPDGELCHNLVVFVSLVNPSGREFGPFASDAFKDNARLQEQGKVLVPLLSMGSTFTLRFAAMEGGREINPREWSRLRHFPLATEPVEFKVEDETAWKVNLVLGPNPEYEPDED
jgi:hypothetical protein